jgi:pseudouridine synthase
MSKKAAPPGNRPLKTLERVFSKRGIGSRTEARSWIGDGKVRVNGRVMRDPDYWVDLERDSVTLDNKPLIAPAKLYILLYKPKGYLTTRTDPEGRPTVYDLISGVGKYLAPAGRLDLDSSGLLILTNDNEFADRIMSPEYKVPKTYQIKASTLLTDEQLDRLRTGVELDDGPTRPATVRRLRDSGKYTHLTITITEGRNRQVRRMVEAMGSKVLELVRIAIGEVTIGDLPIGKWRKVTADELVLLRRKPAVAGGKGHRKSSHRGPAIGRERS